MKTVRVPLHGNVAKSVTLDADATNGAVVGTNLWNPDGSLVTLADLAGGSAGGDLSIDTSDDLDEGGYHFYFTDRRAQDAVGSILVDTADVDFSYVAGTSISASLTATGVVPGIYGDANHTVTLAVDSKGRITAISQTPISSSSAQTFNRIDANGDIRVDAQGNLRVTK